MIKCNIFECNLILIILSLLDILEENNTIFVTMFLFDSLIIFKIVQLIIHLLEFKGVFLSCCRFFTIKSFAQLKIAVSADQLSAFVETYMSLCIGANIYVITNQCSVIVTTCHLDQSLGCYNMTDR